MLHAAGAYIAVQDQASSTVWGMPGSVVSAKLAHATWALDDIAPTLRRLAT
jgi:two-component system chemotaxis response regulator CheB